MVMIYLAFLVAQLWFLLSAIFKAGSRECEGDDSDLGCALDGYFVGLSEDFRFTA